MSQPTYQQDMEQDYDLALNICTRLGMRILPRYKWPAWTTDFETALSLLEDDLAVLEVQLTSVPNAEEGRTYYVTVHTFLALVTGIADTPAKAACKAWIEVDKLRRQGDFPK